LPWIRDGKGKQTMKQWKCTVCGYIHEGEEPPEKCPVCHADRSEFVEVAPLETSGDMKAQVPVSDASSSAPEEESRKGPVQTVLTLMLKHHVHPISAHIPNGVLPVSVIFVFIAIILNLQTLYLASFYNMIFVVLAMPLVLFSGINVWQRKYRGNRTTFFMIKLVCGAVVLVTSVTAVVWGIVDPEVAGAKSPHRWLFATLHVVMLAGAGIAGFIGGKLVFKD